VSAVDPVPSSASGDGDESSNGSTSAKGALAFGGPGPLLKLACRAGCERPAAGPQEAPPLSGTAPPIAAQERSEAWAVWDVPMLLVRAEPGLVDTSEKVMPNKLPQVLFLQESVQTSALTGVAARKCGGGLSRQLSSRGQGGGEAVAASTAPTSRPGYRQHSGDNPRTCTGSDGTGCGGKDGLAVSKSRKPTGSAS